MPRKTFIELLIENAEKRRRYISDIIRYLEEVKRLVRRRDPDARVILFGSVVRGDVKPDSDIDVLIITRLAANLDERIKLRIEITKILGEDSPFELHIVTEEEYRCWYSRFIDSFREI